MSGTGKDGRMHSMEWMELSGSKDRLTGGSHNEQETSAGVRYGGSRQVGQK